MNAEATTMTNRLLYQPATYDQQAPFPALDTGAYKHMHSFGALASNGQGNNVHVLLKQLTQSLAVLSSVCELVLEGRSTAPSVQATQVWLQPNARQAEAAMHSLRDLRLTKSPALTDLSQCLTVLVLAADMLVQGHLLGAEAVPFYDLLRRNADGAMKNLTELRAQHDPAAPVEV
jgi:hypothetical protein